MQNIVKCYIHSNKFISQNKAKIFLDTLHFYVNKSYLCSVLYTGKLCFIIEFIVFYGKVEIYLGLKLIKENHVVTMEPLIPYYYQLYKIPNKKQTDFHNLSHQKFTLYIYQKVLTCKNFICRKTSIIALFHQKSCNLKYICAHFDLLLLLRTDYSVTMTSHQGKKKMTCVTFLLYLYFTEHRKKRDVVLLHTFFYKNTIIFHEPRYS